MTGSRREISLIWALVPFMVMIVTMTMSVALFDDAPHVPLIIGGITAGLVAWCNGYRWQEIETALYEGIKQVLPALVILMLIGLLISAWAAGGLVGTMIYYGLELLSPSYFLPSIMLLCAVATLMMGSSWSTIGTLGVAGLAVGTSMGVSTPAVVGAIVSGSYFGDKMSPLSDTTVLASGITQVDIFEHIKHMLYTTIPGLLLALIVFSFMSGHQDPDQLNRIEEVSQVLESQFVISPWLLLILLVIPVLVICKVPSIPTLLIAIACGALSYLFIQDGDLDGLFSLLQEGYVAHTDNKLVDQLLDQGGLESMMYTVSLAIVAMIFGGLMESTGMLTRIVGVVLKLANTGRKLCAATVISSFITNVVTAEQYISIIIPGRMYAQAFKDQGIHAKNLSRALEDGGTVTSPLVPWSTDAVFIYSTLGVSAWVYAPYAVFDYSIPIISILISLFGIAVVGRSTRPSQSA